MPDTHLRLYVTGRSPASEGARAALARLAAALGPARARAEVVDVLTDPERAREDGVLATPTLLRLAPAPERRVVGSFEDAARVLHALGLAAPGGPPAAPEGRP